MNIQLTDQELELRKTVRSFVQTDLNPIALQVEQSGEIPATIVGKMRDLGLFGISIPEKYNGLGFSTLGEILIYEELAQTNACFRSRIADRTTDIFGPDGCLKKHWVEMFLRDVRLYRIFEGTSEIQRLVISRNLLKH